MATLSCGSCGGSFEAKRSTARFCSSTCQKRAKRAEQSGTAVAPVADLPDTASGDLADKVEEELRAVGRLETSLGRAAVDLARRLDANHRAPLQQAASAHRELRAAIEEAMKGANAPKSALQARRDELAARRARKAQ